MNAARLCLIAFVLTLSLPAFAQTSEVRLGYVDIQRAIRSVEDGQRAMQQLESELSQRQAALDAAEQDLRALTERLDQEIVMMDAETRERSMAEFQAQVEAYQAMYNEHQTALLTMEQEATEEIVNRMVVLVQQIAEERGLAMVFEKTRSALVWAADGLDLTDELIRRYEASE